jgi:hypothetical protein
MCEEVPNERRIFLNEELYTCSSTTVIVKEVHKGQEETGKSTHTSDAHNFVLEKSVGKSPSR